MLSATLFSFAGVAFLFLCIVAGFSWLTAGGVDVPTAPDYAGRVRVVATATFWIGLTTAVAGLVAWIRLWVEGRHGLG